MHRRVRPPARPGGGAEEHAHILRESFPPGRHAFLVSADGYRTARCVAEVVADQAAELEVRLERQ